MSDVEPNVNFIENQLFSKEKFHQFLSLTEILNQKLDIIPVLYGSLGLEKISGVDFKVQDIDILVLKNLSKI